MGKFVLRRALLAFPTILGAATLMFFILRVVPGDVAASIMGEVGPTRAEQEAYHALRRQLGLDQPLVVQYVQWVSNLVRFDLGNSIVSGNNIRGEILHRLTITLQLSLMALVIGLVLGVPLGVLAAFKQDSFFDYGLRTVVAFVQAVPHFWLGVLVLVVGVRFFQWSPPIGYNPIWQGVGKNMQQLIWPALIIASSPVASNARLTRSTMLEVLREDYVRTARAKGLSTRAVLWRHALKNAFIPVFTVAGISLATVVSGSVIMEQIFTIPGVGLFLITAVRQRDYNVVVGVTTMFVFMIVLMNILVDLGYGWLDPRIRYN